MRSKFGTINQSNFGFKDIDRFSSRYRIPPFIGDFFETLTANIVNAKIISTGAGITGQRADLQKGKYLIEVKACRDGGKFKLNREQYNVFVNVSEKLKEYGGTVLYFLYNYNYDWTDALGQDISDVVMMLANNVVRLTVCDIDIVSSKAGNSNTKCIYVRSSDFDDLVCHNFEVTSRHIYNVYFEAFGGVFVEGESFDMSRFDRFMQADRQGEIQIDPTTGDCEESPF